MKFSTFLIITLILLPAICLAGGDADMKSPTPFSVQMHSLTGSYERHRKTIDLMVEAGIRQGRDECFWHMVEQEKGVYKIPESVLRNLDYSLSKGVDTLIILDYANDLYDGGMAPTSEEAVKAFGEYCYTMAHELKGKVHYFEVWNEPNVDGFWRPQKDPAAYTRLLKEGYRRIKEGNPDAKVIGITLAGLDEEFLWKVMDEGGYPYMDAVSVHPYCHPKTPEEAEIFEKMEAIRERFSEYGNETKDIWVTEIGWPTNLGGGVTEYEQAVRISRMYLNAMTYPWLPTVFIYWFGPDGPDEEWAEDRFGMIRQDWSKKPSYKAYKTITTYIHEDSFRKWIIKDESETRLAHYYNQNLGKHVYALWGLNDYVEVLGQTENPVEVVLLSGEKMLLEPFNGIITIKAGTLPVFITSDHEISWSSPDETVINLTWEGNENHIARGKGRKIDIKTDMMKNFSVKFYGSPEMNLSRDEKEGDFFIKTGTKAKSGITRFILTMTAPGKASPSVLALSETDITQPLEINVSPLPPQNERKNFLVSLRNLTTDNVKGDVKINLPEDIQIDKTRFSLPELKSGEVHTERIGITSKHPSDTLFEVKAEANLASGVMIEHEQLITFYESVKTRSPVTINADLSDWPENANLFRMGSKEQRIAGYVEWEGPEDSSANVYTAWDDEWFYIGVELQDDRLSSPCAGFSVYNNDGIEIYFDTDHDGDRNQNRYSDDDHQYGFHLEKGKPSVYSWSQLGGYSKKSRISLNTSPDAAITLSGRNFKGAIIEGAIPLEELGIDPYDGHMIGFSLALTDDDDPLTVHPFFQEIQFSWTHHKNQFQNPTNFGDLFFVDPAKKDEVSIRDRDIMLNGKPFFPFGFWTFGWNEARFRELKKNGINVLGVEFSWEKLEPEPGKFNESYLEDCCAFLDLARKYQLKCVAQPAFHYYPDWLEDEAPGVFSRDSEGKRIDNPFFPYCPDNPRLQQIIQPAYQTFIQAMEGHPALLAWCLWNEPGMSENACYCPVTQSAFGSAPPVKPETGELWLEWMRFRRESFAGFFRWLKKIVREEDTDTPRTIKAVWCPGDSTVAWKHGTQYRNWAEISDIMSHDPYPHPGDVFINRWIADWLRSAAPEKPAWYLEFNRAFGRERGITSPEEISAWTWQAVAHGIGGFFYFFYPMNVFEPDADDNYAAFSRPDTLDPLPATKQIFKIAEEIREMTPLFFEYHVPAPQIAILHSWPTYYQLAGSMYPTANETVVAQILYELGCRADYLTGEDIRNGKLANHRILFVTGTVAVSEQTLLAIKDFHDRGGHVFACARFAEMDEAGNPRDETPPEWFGARVLEREYFDRPVKDVSQVKEIAEFNDGTKKDVTLEKISYGTNHPIQWDAGMFDYFYRWGIEYEGESFDAGEYIGFEDMKTSEEVTEKLSLSRGTRMPASFGPMKPAIALTDRTVYIGRDLSWSDATMRKFILATILRAGVKRNGWIQDEQGNPVPSMDMGILENEEGKKICIVTCHPVEGMEIETVKVKIILKNFNGGVKGVQKDGLWILEKEFHPGEHLVLKEK